jgi:hypothetical protein
MMNNVEKRQDAELLIKSFVNFIRNTAERDLGKSNTYVLGYLESFLANNLTPTMKREMLKQMSLKSK